MRLHLGLVGDIDPVMDDWRERFRALLAEQRLDLTGVARQSGINYQTMEKWLRRSGPSEPSISKALALCKALGISLDALFDTDSPWPPEPGGELADLESPAVQAILSRMVGQALVRVGRQLNGKTRPEHQTDETSPRRQR